MPNEPTAAQLLIDMSNDTWTRAGRGTVGFLAISEGSTVSRGSGTLIKFGKVAGVLTCAHVLEAVLQEEEIGILSFSVRSKAIQTMRVPTNVTDSLLIGSQPWNEHGPDLAFLRLPSATMADIERLSSVVNGDLHRQNILSGVPERARPYNIVCGVIDELTGQPLIKGTVSTTQFEAALNLGHVVDVSDVAGMDLFRFQPIAVGAGVLPTSYQGTSGGGLWQFYLDHDDFSLLQARLTGVVFWEKPVGGELHLIGHGQRSIYDVLLKRIANKWPSEIS